MEKAKLYGLAVAGATAGFLRYYVRPELTAKRAWSALAMGVLAYELACPPGELMSEGADRLIDKHPITTRLGGLMLAGALTGHVLNILPEKRDYVHQGLKALKSMRHA